MGTRSWWVAFALGWAACATQPATESNAPTPTPTPVGGPSASPSSSAAPKVSVGPGKLEGSRLEPSVIQEVVRNAYPTIRTCYESGLARDAKLEGKILTKFVIERDGSVSSATDGGSDLPDLEVRACIQDAFLHLRFPESNGEKITVVYPIRLEPEKK